MSEAVRLRWLMGADGRDLVLTTPVPGRSGYPDVTSALRTNHRHHHQQQQNNCRIHAQENDNACRYAVRIVKSYCLSSRLCACEIWPPKTCDVHSAKINYSNSFRKVFNCCWRENPTTLHYYANSLPLLCLLINGVFCFMQR